MLVKESISFERGLDPKRVLKIGNEWPMKEIQRVLDELSSELGGKVKVRHLTISNKPQYENFTGKIWSLSGKIYKIIYYLHIYKEFNENEAFFINFPGNKRKNTIYGPYNIKDAKNIIKEIILHEDTEIDKMKFIK